MYTKGIHKEGEDLEMNTLVIVLIAAVLLTAAYVFYGRWLSKKWGIDPKAETPAHKFEDGQDYVPTDGWTVFSHQFSSIAGAGPVTGAIQAAVFGWLPVLLWVLIGGIFFGAVTDFGALYASVKNDGKSMGLLIEKYIGKLGRKLFLAFCWLFTLIVIAAFADMVAGTFNAYTVDTNGVIRLADAAKTNGAAGTISLLFIVFAMIFGLIHKHFQLTGWKETVVGLVCTVAALAIGMSLQGSLSNFAGGILILIFKPFKVGDYIIVGTNEGTVKSIEILYTRLVTIDNKVVMLPNGSLSNSSIVNVGAENTRRIDIQIGIGYSSDIPKAKKLLEQVINSEKGILKDKDILVVVKSLDESCVTLETRAWVNTADYWNVRFNLLERYKNIFDENGIEIPFNQLDVHMK